MLDNNLSFWNLCRDISKKIIDSKVKVWSQKIYYQDYMITN
jgi:hypothetical protein